MKNLWVLACLLLLASQAFAQAEYERASVNEDGILRVESVMNTEGESVQYREGNAEQIMSFSAAAFPTTKNTRGVSLADLDGDGLEEIIFGIYDTLYAMKSDGSILFKKAVSGPILLPPTVADLDGDGQLEVIVNSGYPRQGGGITAVDNEGNDLDGWPLSFGGNWMSNAPVAVDLDGDGIMEIVAVEYVSGAVGNVHVLKLDGSPYNDNWPVNIGAPPAFTPSVGDVNGDGNLEIVIAGSSNGMHVLNLDGEHLPGFPAKEGNVSYSYQSPILVDLDGDGQLEIVGSNHGDDASFYAMRADGSYMEGWPVYVDTWTYGPPTVADLDGDGEYEIFMGLPLTDSEGAPMPVIHGLHSDGTYLEHFPIEKAGGNEGVIAIADVNNDGVPDLIFSSNVKSTDDYGFIHAYAMDGSGELEGFPLRPRGFTFLNGAVLGDVNGDGKLDLSVMSYTSNFGASPDSAFVTVYNLDYPYIPENIIRNGYKGSNTRQGLVTEETTSIVETTTHVLHFFPNPSPGQLNLNLEGPAGKLDLYVYDMQGRMVYVQKDAHVEGAMQYELHQLDSGVYIVRVNIDGELASFKWLRQ